MPTWFNAVGVMCIAVVCGYILLYSFKRLQPPLRQTPLAVGEVIALLAAITASGTLGRAFVSLEGVNYIGAYGVGLLLGATINIVLTILHEDSFGLRKRRDNKPHQG